MLPFAKNAGTKDRPINSDLPPMDFQLQLFFNLFLLFFNYYHHNIE